MTVSTDQPASRAHALVPPSVTVTLDRPASTSLKRLQEHTHLSPSELANCALTWYAYVDAQLRAGYSLTLWNTEAGKAYTLSLSANSPALPGGRHRSPAGRVHCFTDSSCPSALPHQRHRPPPGPAFTAVKFRLAGAGIRGSPAAFPGWPGRQANHCSASRPAGPELSRPPGKEGSS
jgi:hypothetical protein